MFVFVLFLLWFNVPVNNFSSHVETEPPIPGYYQYFLGSKCLLLKETNTPTRPRIEPGSPDPKSDARMSNVHEDLNLMWCLWVSCGNKTDCFEYS